MTKDTFVKSVVNSTGLSEDEVINFLREKFGTYVNSKQKEYREAINAMIATKEKRAKIEKKLKSETEIKYPCPICGAETEATLYFVKWRCTEGGYTHSILAEFNKRSGKNTFTKEKIEEIIKQHYEAN